ncbi:MAG: NUDIX hydrolase [Pseudomonadota bacterium]
MRQFGSPPRRSIAYTRRPGVYAVILRGGQMLTTFQNEPEPEFQLPGGGIDPGEAPIPALHREVMEETGWTIAVRCRLGIYQTYRYMPDYDLWARKLCTLYLCSPGLRRGPPLEPGHSAHWMPADVAVRAIASPGDRFYAARALRSHRDG